MFDPLSIILGCVAIASASNKVLKPVEERFDTVDRFNKAIEQLESMQLKLGIRSAVLADNERNMQKHAERMAGHHGGFDLSKEEDVYDFCEDMRVQLKVGERAEQVFREHGSVCRKCGQVVTNVEHIEGKKK